MNPSPQPSSSPSPTVSDLLDQSALSALAQRLVEAALRAGADAADALAVAITHAHVRASADRLGVATRAAWGRKGRGRG